MTHVVVCDVCETQLSSQEWDGMGLVIPEGYGPDIEPGTYDVCSWQCLENLADSQIPREPHGEDDEEENIDEPIALIPDDDVQIRLRPVRTHAPEEPRRVDVPVPGVTVRGPGFPQA